MGMMDEARHIQWASSESSLMGRSPAVPNVTDDVRDALDINEEI